MGRRGDLMVSQGIETLELNSIISISNWGTSK